VGALNRGLELLDSAVGYALVSTAAVTPRLLSRRTPCRDWDLAALLDHVADSLATLREALGAGRVTPASRPCGGWPDPAELVRAEARALLATCRAAGRHASWIVIGDRALTPAAATVLGAVEITVHGWDVSVACGEMRPIPPDLAAILLAVAPALVTAADRPDRFAAPVKLPAPATSSDALVAFLGRRPPQIAGI
jgi:uncharacterized protein (TIGR03086 family)